MILKKKLLFINFILLLLLLTFIIIEIEQTNSQPTFVETIDTNDLLDKEIIQEEEITNKLLLENENSAIASNVQLTRTEEGIPTKITFSQGGTLTIKTHTPNGKSVQHSYSNLEKIPNKEIEIHVDKNGKIVEAYFKIKKEQTIVLGNEILKNLPSGTEVSYKDGIATIKQPKGSSINVPQETIDKKVGESTFYYEYVGSNEFKLPNAEIFTGEKLGYERGKLFFDTTTAKFGNDITVSNPDKVKTFIVTKIDDLGKPDLDHNGAYISINRPKKTIAVGVNIQGGGPAYLFSSNSDFIKDIGTEVDNLAIQAFSVNGESSYIQINKRAQNLVAKVTTFNGYIIDDDRRSLFYNPTKQASFIDTRNNRIKGLQMSKNFIPIEIESLQLNNNNILNVFRNKNVMVVGNDGRMVLGSNPRFIADISSGYKSNPGLKQGVSNLVSYNEPATVNSFRRFTGINFNDKVGISSSKLRMLMNVFGNAPPEMSKNIKNLEIVNIISGWSGKAWPSGLIRLNDRNRGVNANTALHETGHQLDFKIGRRGSNFINQWNSVGGSSRGHTEKYATISSEDVSTFVEHILKDSWGRTNNVYFKSWNKGLNPGYRYFEVARAKVVLAYQYDFITRKQLTRVFDLAGLPSNNIDLIKYYKEAGGR